MSEITKGAKCHVVYDGVGKATFPASLDCLRPFGMFVSFGSASGGIEAFNLGLLAQKGSLFATRPTLFTFLADRARAEKMARDLFRVVANGDVEIRIGKRCRSGTPRRPNRPSRGARRPARCFSCLNADRGLSCAEFLRSRAGSLGEAGPPLYRRRGRPAPAAEWMTRGRAF